MKYWLDTEFIERGREHSIDLISIALVAEDGREFYAENLEVDLSKANDWVKVNVIPHLWSKQKDKSKFNLWSRDGGVGGLLPRRDIASEIHRFCHPNTYGTPEFWADYGSYHWVIFSQLFGLMVDLPEGFPMYCNDIQQLERSLREEAGELINKMPTQLQGLHHALEDARQCKKKWEFITQ